MHTDGELSAYLKSTGLLLNKQLNALEIKLFHENITIGRGKANKVSISVRTISDHHAIITYTNNQWFIEDLQSKTGVKINDIRINSIIELKEDDIVSIGGVEFVFGLNKPEILLRQDTIIMHATQIHDFNKQLNGGDATLHLNYADFISDLKGEPLQNKKELSKSGCNSRKGMFF